jgi:hypothetical protein
MARTTVAQRKADERADAIAQLRETFPVGSEVSLILRHVSSSGMTRAISVIGTENGRPVDVSWQVARALDWRLHPTKDGVKVGGCGMDMGFHLVYSLARVIYRDGFPCTGRDGYGADRCPSNDHSNERERDYTPDRMHSDPGYALRARWL